MSDGFIKLLESLDAFLGVDTKVCVKLLVVALMDGGAFIDPHDVTGVHGPGTGE